jgi:hypothetical protein
MFLTIDVIEVDVLVVDVIELDVLGARLKIHLCWNLKQQGPLVLRHVKHKLVKLAGHQKSFSIFIATKK